MLGKRRNEGKEPVPVYQMERSEAYLLLRLLMEITGKKHISGVQKAFFAPETYKRHEKLIKSLAKKKYAQMKDGNLMISEDLKANFNRMLDSVHCMAFQNAELMENGTTLAFYYADGKYVGFLQNPKKVILTAHEDPEAIYHVFAPHFDADGISKQFRMENWLALWRGPANAPRELNGPMAETMEKPVREAMILNTGNRLGRTDFSVSMISDGEQIHMIRGFGDSKFDELDRSVMSAVHWHPIIVTELKRLKDEHNYRCNIKVEEPVAEEAAPPTDYQQITSSPGFPKGRIGFLFWTLKCFIKGIPLMIERLVRSKFVSLIVAAVWGLFIFFYNMYITCYFNDTFMLERRAKWGNLSPYLMGATLRTPSDLKGFDVKLGNIETTFLVAPMLMFVTFLGRHLFLRFKERKLGFIKDFFGLFKTAREDRSNGFGKGRNVWFIMAFTFTVGFLLMNPFSLFLAAFYAFLIYEQGKKNGFIQYIMFYRCAAMRRRVDAGKADEPDYRSINMFFYLFGCGMFLYGLISVLLWFIADYSFWIRAVVSLLMVLFAMIQACMPGLLTGKRAKALAGIVLFFGAAVVVSRILPGGVVLADDGGWSESGGNILGLIQNAGFSTILGVTVMTLGIALGGPVGWMIAGGTIIGGGNFLLGLTDTKAGDYVRKSARQFFNAPAEGEDYTLLCTATKIGSFIAGFVNPAAGAGATTVKALQVGKITSDLISTTDSTVDFVNSIHSYINGDGSFSDVVWSGIGLGLDMYSTGNDINKAADDWADIAKQGDAYKYKPDADLADKMMENETDRNAKLYESETYYDQKRQDLWNQDKAMNEYNREITGLEREIRDVEAGKVKPPAGMSKEEYIDKLKGYQDDATKGFVNRGEEIRESVQKEMDDAAQRINDEFDRKINNEIIDKGMDWASKGKSGKDLTDTLTHDSTPNDASGGNDSGQSAVDKGSGVPEKQSPKAPEKESSTETPKESSERPVRESSTESEKTSENKPEKAGPKNSPQEAAKDSSAEPVNVPEQAPGKGTQENSPQIPEKRTPEHSPQESAKEGDRESGNRTVTTISDVPSEGIEGETEEFSELEEIDKDGKKKKKDKKQ